MSLAYIKLLGKTKRSVDYVCCTAVMRYIYFCSDDGPFIGQWDRLEDTFRRGNSAVKSQILRYYDDFHFYLRFRIDFKDEIERKCWYAQYFSYCIDLLSRSRSQVRRLYKSMKQRFLKYRVLNIYTSTVSNQNGSRRPATGEEFFFW